MHAYVACMTSCGETFELHLLPEVYDNMGYFKVRAAKNVVVNFLLFPSKSQIGQHLLVIDIL